jgi:hypothetical protein
MPEEIDTKLYDLLCKERFDNIETSVKEGFNKTNVTLEKIWDRIEGNGGTGLVEEIAVLQEKDKEKDKRWKWLAGAGTAILLPLIGKLIYDLVSHLNT